jgi:hypothetical protein
MHDRAQTYCGGLGVKFGLALCCCDGSAPGLGTHRAFTGHVEIDRFNLIRAGGDQIDQQLLHIVEVA